MVIASLGFAATVFGPLAASGQSIASKTVEIALRSADEESRRNLLQMILMASDIAPEAEAAADDAAEDRDAETVEETVAAGTDPDGADRGQDTAETAAIDPARGEAATDARPERAESDEGGIFARETPIPVGSLTETVQLSGSGSGSLLPTTSLTVSYDLQTTSQSASPGLMSATTAAVGSSPLLETGGSTTGTGATDAQSVLEEATSGTGAVEVPTVSHDPADAPASDEPPNLEADPAGTGEDTGNDGTGGDTGNDGTGGDAGEDTETGGSTGNGAPDQSGMAVSPFGAKVISGRVTTLDLGEAGIEDIQIVKGPSYGNLTVNPDNTLALVLTGETRTDDISFKVQLTFQNGTTKTLSPTLDVAKGPQAAGWGLGDFYMLETDADDRIVVEHGDNHRKVYVSGSKDALSASDIAKLEGLSAKEIGQRFFLDHPEYGATEDMAVTAEVASFVWRAYSSRGVEEPTSNWMLFERGFKYDDIIGLMASGESALNPVYYGAYGTGTDPVLEKSPTLIKGGGHNIVFQDIELAEGVRFLAGSNILLDHVSFSNGLNIQNIDGFTLRYADVVDVVTEQPNGKLWNPHKDRASGIYTARSEGILIEDSFFDHNGWEDGYDYHMSAKFGQPPSQYSHNVYLQVSNRDVTFRDNIVMRAAADGAQVRSGGYVEDNVFIDNNNALLAASGGRQGNGNYSLLLDNVVTSAAHKDTEFGTGGLTRGISSNGFMPSMVGNIVAHLSDPNNFAEWLEKRASHFAVNSKKGDPFYDDTIVHNWVGSYKYARDDYDARDANITGLDYDVLDKTTIQIFAAKLLNQKTATIEDLADYLRAQADDGALNDVVDADLIIGFFRKGFGLEVALRDDAETLRFVPNDLGEGMRWDNRLNWTSESLPGASPDDNVELAGNWVIYGGTTTIGDLSLGSGGRLTLAHGRLEVEGTLEAGAGGSKLLLDNAGQLWTHSYEDSDMLRIEAAGGRFVNAGMFRGLADIVVSEDAQVVLATGGGQFALDPGSSLTIRGGAAKIGIDSVTDEAAIITLGRNSDLRFESEDGQLGLVREFYSGTFDSDSDAISSGIDLGGADLTVDVSALPRSANKYTLLYLDEMIGSFDDVMIEGLGKKRDATVTVNYELDAVMLTLGKDGSGRGKTTLDTVGTPDDAETLSPDIWDALIEGQSIWNDPLVSHADTTL